MSENSAEKRKTTTGKRGTAAMAFIGMLTSAHPTSHAETTPPVNTERQALIESLTTRFTEQEWSTAVARGLKFESPEIEKCARDILRGLIARALKNNLPQFEENKRVGLSVAPEVFEFMKSECPRKSIPIS